MPEKGKSDKTKVAPQASAKSQRGALQKLSKIKIQGNKEVPIVLRAIFSNYDKDASGSITKPEMTALVLDLQSLLPGTPAHLKHCSEVVAKIAMAALDLDKGGTIDEDEFVEFWLAMCYKEQHTAKEEQHTSAPAVEVTSYP